MEVQVMQDILGSNDKLAAENKKIFDEYGIFVLNLIGSPGAGKTSLLEKTIGSLKNHLRLAVIEGDLFTSKDADRIADHDVPVIQINTSGGCHLDAMMVKKVLSKLDLQNLDLVIIENVGNLVCPAEFNIGEDTKAVVLSITEGDDKPLKYPLIFKEASAVVLNKIDILPFTNFDMENARHDINCLHPGISIIETSCRTDNGLDQWCSWLRAAAYEKNERMKKNNG
ncbi:hydrogenase nickel incorporation protein HypB [Pectinatus haikarae]|uniref:Hydrogenase nickel incorporation protein HypB n=1 Tax=Pectinatus haikarae TaxID=349096 RepID=A0ABT9Y3J5_9FIRM|nr:hydrogenase nickel incorporation protein HypB [Pectinatus haikarae]MDQ0202382.1 hydrogenase nickel incorporation protein HypB [Pectinatus haikarae]